MSVDYPDAQVHTKCDCGAGFADAGIVFAEPLDPAIRRAVGTHVQACCAECGMALAYGHYLWLEQDYLGRPFHPADWYEE